MFEARDLTLSWDGATEVVRGLSLSVDAGETVCVVGRSGTGKTTLLHALAGLTRPMRGSVVLDGRNITGCPGHVAYMLQKDLLLPSERVIDNVCLPLTLRGASRDEARAIALPLLERFGLKGAEDAWPRELSGGMRQRAAFLRTHLMGAEVMLLDEPFSALDAITRSELRGWFVQMADELGLSALIITHDVDEALICGDRVLVLAGAPKQGRPSAIVGEVACAHADAPGEDFSLTPEFAAAKRRILDVL